MLSCAIIRFQRTHLVQGASWEGRLQGLAVNDCSPVSLLCAFYRHQQVDVRLSPSALCSDGQRVCFSSSREWRCTWMTSRVPRTPVITCGQTVPAAAACELQHLAVDDWHVSTYVHLFVFLQYYYYLRQGGYVVAFVRLYVSTITEKKLSTNFDELFGAVGWVTSNR